MGLLGLIGLSSGLSSGLIGLSMGSMGLSSGGE